MQRSPTALVLGGTTDHRALIECLHERGYRTVLVDYLADPPAREVADVHVRESALDTDAVVRVARATEAELVISACIDQALATACEAAQRLGLSAPFSGAEAFAMTNKVEMKSRMVRAGIPTSRHVEWGTDDDLAGAGTVRQLDFPVVVKPADCNGSRGVRRAVDEAQLRRFADEARQLSRTGKVIVEEFSSGVEVSVDCFVMDGEVTVLQVGRIWKKMLGATDSAITRWTNYSDLSPIAWQRLTEVLTALARAFDLTATPLRVQAMVDGDDISVIEFSPRVGGGSKHILLREALGISMLDHVIDAFTGHPTSPRPTPCTRMYQQDFLYASPCLFGELRGTEGLLANGVVDHVITDKKSGARISEPLVSSNRMGSVIISAGQPDELAAKAESVRRTVEAVDTDGRPVLRKDLLRGPWY